MGVAAVMNAVFVTPEDPEDYVIRKLKIDDLLMQK
jgi:hypothetical protein